MCQKKYTIRNHVVFGLVMRRPNIAKKCLETILGKEITKLNIIETEKSEEVSPDIHGVRFDVYCENEDTVYDVELQAYEITDLGKRTRYYQDMMDMTLLEKGEPYSSLKKNIVIFICTFDPYEKGRHLYSFGNRCEQDASVKLDDGTTKIILNTKGTIDDIPKELKLFLDYIETDKVLDSYTREVDNAVKEIQNDKRWRANIMTFEQVIKDAAFQAKNEGKAEGISEEKKETVSRMIKMGEFSDDTICKIVDLSSDELDRIKESL